ncbi:MAG: D-alanyl-D-alanine carboxypeptidase/D-alanyl-D-alanine-endopeptidase [Gemmatimonadota bacterium]
MRRFPAVLAIFLALLALHPAPIRAQDAALRDQLETWYAGARRSSPGEWGVVVANQQGEVIWSVNATTPMIPASTVKLLTTGFARTKVGPDARRSTRLLGTGSLDTDSGIWRGTWALELNGDPTLERPSVAGPSLASLASQLRTIGIRRLSGPLHLTTQVGEATARYPAAWSPRHRGRYFAPPVGMVTLNENVVGFMVAPGSRSGEPAVLITEVPAGIAGLVTIEAKTVTGSRTRLSARPDGSGWIVTGTIGVSGASKGWTFVAHDPTAVVRSVWSRALWHAGIDWDAEAPAIPDTSRTVRVLAEIASPPFDSIAHEINTRSVNIGAELMLAWAGGPLNAPQQLERHVREVTGMDGIHLVDGSGLSDNDRVPPLVFTTYLANFPATSGGRDFPLLLPANGSGTLKSLATGLPEAGVVRAKTGTLGNAVTLVGYLGRPGGMLLVAAMYSGTHLTPARQKQWELFRTLGAQGIVIPPSDLIGTALGSESTPD